ARRGPSGRPGGRASRRRPGRRPPCRPRPACGAGGSPPGGAPPPSRPTGVPAARGQFGCAVTRPSGTVTPRGLCEGNVVWGVRLNATSEVSLSQRDCRRGRASPQKKNPADSPLSTFASGVSRFRGLSGFGIFFHLLPLLEGVEHLAGVAALVGPDDAGLGHEV